MKKRKNIKKRILITILLAVIASVLGILGVSLLNKDIDNINYVASLLNRGEGETINIEDNSEITVEVLKKFYTYDGTGKRPKVRIKYGTKTLAEGINYKLSYSNNVNVGKATIKIEGNYGYTGTMTAHFIIREDYGNGTEENPWDISENSEAVYFDNDACGVYAYLAEDGGNNVLTIYGNGSGVVNSDILVDRS